jgi:uncharacterized membrane protein HdeD (DUF308 family)
LEAFMASALSGNDGRRSPTLLTDLSAALRKAWWLVMLRGAVAALFGIAVIAWPALALTSLLLLFAVFCLADGVVGISTVIAGRSEHRWLQLLWALVSVGAGLATLLVPGITALALLFYIAAWAIASGVLQIVAAVQLRREIEGEWLLLLNGVVTVVLGIVLFARPGAGALAIATLLGIFAVVSGAALLALGWRARRFQRAVSAAATRVPAST